MIYWDFTGNSCPFGEMEAMALACGVSRMTYLKRFTLKIIQYLLKMICYLSFSGLQFDEECIYEFVSAISKNLALEQFDIYMRG